MRAHVPVFVRVFPLLESSIITPLSCTLCHPPPSQVLQLHDDWKSRLLDGLRQEGLLEWYPRGPIFRLRGGPVSSRGDV